MGPHRVSGASEDDFFSSPAAAQTELVALVRQETDSGYMSVAAGPNAAAIEERVTIETPGYVLTDAQRKRLLFRRATSLNAGEPDLAAARARIQDAYGKTRSVWQGAERTSDPDLAPLVLPAMARLEGATAPASPEVEAAAYVMLLHRTHYDELRGEDLVDEWLAAHDPEFALAALAGTLRMSFRNPADGLKRSTRGAPPPLVNGNLHGWRRLRARLSGVEEASWARARDLAARLRATGDDLERHATAFLFPDEPGWAAADARAAIAAGQMSRVIGSLLASLDDGALMLALLDRGDSPAGLLPSASSSPLPDVLEMTLTMVERVGPAAAPAIWKLHELDTSLEWRRACAEALATLHGPEVATQLADKLWDKELLAAATKSFLRAPRFALPALAARVGPDHTGQLAETLLSMVVRRDPSLAEELLPSLPDASRRAITAITRKQRLDLPDATPAQLPPVLAAPPWLAKRRRTESGPLDLAVLSRPEDLAWPPGVQQAWKSAAVRTFTWDRPMTPAERAHFSFQRIGIVSAELAALHDRTARCEYIAKHAKPQLDPAALIDLPRALATELMDVVPLDRWSTSGRQARGVLADLELLALPWLSQVLHATPREAFDIIENVDSTRFVPLVARAYVHTKSSRALAQSWLLRYPETTAVALVPDAVAADARRRAIAGAVLRLLAAQGEEDSVVRAAGLYGAEAATAVRAVLDTDPLELVPTRAPKLPPFFDATALTPPLLVDRSAKLSASAIEAIATMLAFSQPDDPYAGLTQVKDACEPTSLGQMAWDLFSAWKLAGYPSKHGWAMQALAVFGDDDCARKLAALIREWPGQPANARAAQGLDVLARIGSDVALMHIDGIAQRVKYKGLQDDARAKIAQIAEQRGFTPEDLADRLVPDLGLDERGTLRLDYGPRHFTVGFDERLLPTVRDATGEILSDLPKPGKTDDLVRANEALSRWKGLKKDAKTLSTQQARRLEQAMCSRRKWTIEVFRLFLAEHPLMRHLVKRLVWGSFDPGDRLATAFLVSEDGRCSDADGEAVDLSERDSIGLVHALDLGPELSARLAGRFGPEALQPFLQLGRGTHSISDVERARSELTRFRHETVRSVAVLGLENRGWRRGPAGHGGVSDWFEKRLSDDYRAWLRIEPGFNAGKPNDDPEQTIATVDIVGQHERTLPSGALHPVVLSELIRDVETLRT